MTWDDVPDSAVAHRVVVIEAAVPEPGLAADSIRRFGRRLIGGARWSVGGQAVALLTSFVATPFLIRLLGQDEYGLWVLVQTILSYLAVADIGMQSASTRLASEAYVEGSAELEASVIWTATAVSLSCTLLLCLAVWVAAPFLLGPVLHLSGTTGHSALIAIRVICVALIGQCAAGTLNTPQLVRLKWAGFTFITFGTAAMENLAAPIALATVSGGVVTVAVVAAAAMVTAAVGNFAVSRRILPKLWPPRVQRSLVRPLLRFGGGLAVASIAAIPLTNIERVFLVHFRSTAALAYYGVAVTWVALLGLVPSQLIGLLMPALSRLDSENDSHGSAILMEAVLGLAALTLIPGAMVLLVVTRPLIRVWAGTSYALHTPELVLILLVGTIVNSFAKVPYVLMLARKRTRTIAVMQIIEVVCYVGVAAVLTSWLGAAGAAAAYSLRLVADGIALFAITGRWSGVRIIPPIRVAVSAGGCFVGLGLALFAISREEHSLPVLLPSVLVFACCYLAAAWHLILKDSAIAQSLVRGGPSSG